MYRFLLTWRWLLAAVLAIAAALVMARLGEWQLHRYQERHAINTRIDAADSTQAVPLTSVVAPPTTAGHAGKSPGNSVAWTKVTFDGHYDPTHEIQARARTVNGDVGFEILTPLLLSDGNGVLVDRGWVPAPDAGALAAPVVPPAPTGLITVVGQIHLSESRPTPIEHRDGRLDTRRISVPRLAAEMPFPVYGAYVLLTGQTPANDAAFTKIPIDGEDDWQNAGYTVQWWLFALMTLYAYVWYARKEAQLRASGADRSRSAPPPDGDRPAEADRELAATATAPGRPARAGAGPTSAERAEEADRGTSTDRVEEAARRPPATASSRASLDRVAEADRKREDRVEEANLKRAAKQKDRLEEADRKRAATQKDRVDEADRKRGATQKDRVEEADRRRAEAAARKAPIDRIEEADRKRAEMATRKAPVDRVDEADRKRAEAEAKRRLAAPSGQD